MQESNFLISRSEMNYGKNGEELYEQLENNDEFKKQLKERIKRILEDKIKGGIGYYDSILGKEAKKREVRSRKKKAMKDESAEFLRRHRGGKKSAKKNSWIKFVKEFRDVHPEIKSRDVFRLARPLYLKMKSENYN